VSYNRRDNTVGGDVVSRQADALFLYKVSSSTATLDRILKICNNAYVV
jgi:hypothetical protein